VLRDRFRFLDSREVLAQLGEDRPDSLRLLLRPAPIASS